MFAWQNVLYMYYWELKWFWILCSIMTNGLIVKRWKWWTNTWNRIHFPTTRATISLVKNGHLPLFLSVSLFAMNSHSLSEGCCSLSLIPLPLDSWNPKHPISNRKFLSLSLAQRGFRRNDHLSLFLPVSLSAMNNLTTHFPRRGQQFLSRSLPLQWTLSLSLWAMSLTLFAPSSVGLFKP